jgi:hypothetical protein
MRKLTFLFYLTFLIPNIVTGNLVEIYSLDQMDDPRGFCIDIRGHKSKAKTNSGLQAHTCYSYQGSIASASLRLSECQDEELQKFEWDNNGRIYLISNMKLCLTVTQGKSRKGGGGSPIHLMRNLSLELCGDKLQAFQMWGARSER